MAAIVHPKPSEPRLTTSTTIEAWASHAYGGKVVQEGAVDQHPVPVSAPVSPMIESGAVTRAQRRGSRGLRSPGSEASMPRVSRKPRRPRGVMSTAWLRFILSSQPRSK